MLSEKSACTPGNAHAIGESETLPKLPPGADLVLRLYSVKNWAKTKSENWVFSIARKRRRKRNVLCFRFTIVFPKLDVYGS